MCKQCNYIISIIGILVVILNLIQNLSMFIYCIFICHFLSFFLRGKKKKSGVKKEKTRKISTSSLTLGCLFFLGFRPISYTRYCALHTLVKLLAEHCLKHEVQVCEA